MSDHEEQEERDARGSNPLLAWVERARPHLMPAIAAAHRLEAAIAADALHSGSAAAYAQLVMEETNGALSWLLADACPDPDAAVELRATLAVLRNAAIAFRGLAPDDDASQLLDTCESLLEQGRHHLGSFEEMTGLQLSEP